MSDPPAEQLSLRNPSTHTHTHTARTNLALSLSSSLSEGSEACAVREMTRSRSGALPPLHCYGRLAVPEQLGEETLEEDEVDEDLKPQEPQEQGPGFRERSGAEGTRHSCHAKAALQNRSSCNPPKPKKQTPHPKPCLSICLKMSKTKVAMST